MKEENQYPSFLQQGKNLASFSWELLNFVIREKIMFVSDDVYKERYSICKSCEKFDATQESCKECGCYVPSKAKFILDSCPLEKWTTDYKSWEEQFSTIESKINLSDTSSS